MRRRTIAVSGLALALIFMATRVEGGMLFDDERFLEKQFEKPTFYNFWVPRKLAPGSKPICTVEENGNTLRIKQEKGIGYVHLHKKTVALWNDYTAAFQFKRIGPWDTGKAGFSFRTMPHGKDFQKREVILFSGNSVETQVAKGLMRKEPLTKELAKPLPSDKWIDVRVECEGNNFKVYLGKDSKTPVLSGKTQAEAGSICFAVEECEAVFRDLKIERIGAYGEGAPAPVGKIDNSALLYWRFDEGKGGILTDSSGKRNIGKINEKNIPRWIDGKMGKALEWIDPVTGSGVTFQVALDCPIIQTGGVTAELWVMPREYPEKTINLIARIGYDITLQNNGRIRARVTLEHPKGWNHSWPGVATRKPIPLHEWTHIALTYSEKTREIRLYVNGEIAGINKNLKGFRDYHLNKGSDYPLTVAGQGFVGAVDEVRISAMPREDFLIPAQ